MRNSAYKLILPALAVILTSIGCNKAAPPEFRFAEVEWLKQEKLHLGDGEQFSPKYKTEIPAILETLFGTPEHAWFPFDDSDSVGGRQPILDRENLRVAAGAVASVEDGSHLGLYREHCAQCHGVTGDGAGPTAAFLYPYPRDFRMGKFKFKSTPQRRPPTDADLRRAIVHGIPGTAMPSFQRLPDDELQALVDYVKYLSIRGQFEWYLLNEVVAIDDDPFLSDEEQGRWFQPVDRTVQVKVDVPDESTEIQAEPVDYQHRTEEARSLAGHLRELIGDQFWELVVDRWAASEANVSPVPVGPTELGDLDLVAQGRVLFVGKGGCQQCHGADGRGVGEVENNYDDWTKRWTDTAGVDPTDKSSFQDFTAAGALRPRVISPRNLTMGIYRGGGDPDQLYRRIANGIEGTPMPAATALSAEEIWALVAYVLALPDQASPEPAGN